MHELSDPELYHAIAYARGIDEAQGKQILAQFESDQSALYQTIFGVFPGIIAQQNQDMAYLFMDLCFDVICIFQHAFGDPPKIGNSPKWLEKQAALLGSELQALLGGSGMDEKIRNSLKERFVKRGADEVMQLGLIKFLNAAIDEHASLNTNCVPAIPITQAMIFAVVRLFSSLYGSATQH